MKTHLTGYMGSLTPAGISTFLLLFRIRHKGRYKTWAGCLTGTQKVHYLLLHYFVSHLLPFFWEEHKWKAAAELPSAVEG